MLCLDLVFPFDPYLIFAQKNCLNVANWRSWKWRWVLFSNPASSSTSFFLLIFLFFHSTIKRRSQTALTTFCLVFSIATSPSSLGVFSVFFLFKQRLLCWQTLSDFLIGKCFPSFSPYIFPHFHVSLCWQAASGLSLSNSLFHGLESFTGAFLKTLVVPVYSNKHFYLVI